MMVFTVRRHNPQCGWAEVLCGPRDAPGWRYVSEMRNGYCSTLYFLTGEEADSFAAIYNGVTHLEATA